MGLFEAKSKMAFSPASSSSPDSAIVVTSESSSPSSAAPKKKRTFDIAFLTGQSETSDEAPSITGNEKFSPSSVLVEEDDYQCNNRFTVLSQNSAASALKTESSQVTNHNFSVRSGTNSSSDVINNGSCQNNKALLENGSKYKLFATPSGNNNNSNGYLVQNLWKDQSNADTSSNPKTSGRGLSRKNRNSQAADQKSIKSSAQGARPDSKKLNDLSPQLSSPSDMHYLHSQHMKDESSSPERQSFDSVHLRTNHDLVSSASFQARNLPPSSLTFLPQIGRFPIHLPSPLMGNNHQAHNGSASHSLNPQPSSTFSPPMLGEKLTKEQHQQIISAFHQHQQQSTMNKIRAAAANGFSPENLYPHPYAPYPSAAAAAMILSQSPTNSPIANLGLVSPTPMQGFHHNGNPNSGANGNGAPSAVSPTGNPMVTATLLPPSLTSLTLPAQNVCAKCNIGFRMTSDLVYHMRSHHKRETDPMKKKREDKLKCSVCLETFRERHHLTRHMTAHQDRAEEMIHDATIEHESKPIVV